MIEETATRDPYTVELVRHRAWNDKSPIPDWEYFDQFQVYVHSVGLAHRNKDCKLMVGYIATYDAEKRPNPNFCPAPEFYSFTYAQQQDIAQKAKDQHGKASSAPHVELPPPLVFDEEDEEDED